MSSPNTVFDHTLIFKTREHSSCSSGEKRLKGWHLPNGIIPLLLRWIEGIYPSLGSGFKITEAQTKGRSSYKEDITMNKFSQG